MLSWGRSFLQYRLQQIGRSSFLHPCTWKCPYIAHEANPVDLHAGSADQIGVQSTSLRMQSHCIAVGWIDFYLLHSNNPCMDVLLAKT